MGMGAKNSSPALHHKERIKCMKELNEQS